MQGSYAEEKPWKALFYNNDMRQRCRIILHNKNTDREADLCCKTSSFESVRFLYIIYRYMEKKTFRIFSTRIVAYATNSLTKADT